MADNINPVMSVIVADSSKLKDLVIKDRQLIFCPNKKKIALDAKGRRTFYNQIEILETDAERQTLENPINENFYFVKSTAIFYHYDNGWIPLTNSPKEILYVGENMPIVGSENTLYVDTANKEINVWNENKGKYDIVADVTKECSEDDIDKLFI